MRCMFSKPNSQHTSQLPKIWHQVHNGVMSSQYVRKQNAPGPGLEGDSASLAGLSLADDELVDDIENFD